MARQILVVLTAVVLLSSILQADEPKKKVSDFTLEDCKGEKHSLTDYSASKAIVLMFIATQCPVSNGYNSRMADLYHDYKDKGVAFLGINSNKAESIDDIRFSGDPERILRAIAIEPAQRSIDVFRLKAREHLIHAHSERFQARWVNIHIDLSL